MKHVFLIIASGYLFCPPAFADAAQPSAKEHAHGAEGHSASGGTKGHVEGHEAAEEGEGSKIGPGKGIEAYDEHEGLKLSKQALKNFAIETVPLEGAGPWRVPEGARVFSGEETNLYRLRDGFFSRIDFKELARNAGFLTVASSALQANDQIVVSGQGFLRIAEIAASGGAPEGHSH